MWPTFKMKESGKRASSESAGNDIKGDVTSQLPTTISACKRRKLVGPALPPTYTQKNDAVNHQGSGSESDSDDDIGPGIPPSNILQPEERSADYKNNHDDDSSKVLRDEESCGPAKSQRDSWMLQPPGSTDRACSIDTTRIRSRKFQTGRSARNPTGGNGIDTTWTETPEQKIKRLEDEVMGVASSPGKLEGRPTDKARRNEVIGKKVQQYNDMARKERLYDNSDHKSKDTAGDDDPSLRVFDREKDLALSSKISAAQRREMVKKAADFGSRFTGGKFL